MQSNNAAGLNYNIAPKYYVSKILKFIQTSIKTQTKHNLDTTSLSITINLFHMKTMISINVHFCLKKYYDVSSRREQQENRDRVIVVEAPSLP